MFGYKPTEYSLKSQSGLHFQKFGVDLLKYVEFLKWLSANVNLFYKG